MAQRFRHTCFRAVRLWRNSGGGQRELWVLNETDGGSRRAPNFAGIAAVL